MSQPFIFKEPETMTSDPLPYSAEELPTIIAQLDTNWSGNVAMLPEQVCRRMAATLSELARLQKTIEEMRMPEATADDAPPEWGNSEAAAWADGFTSAMQEVHQAAIGGGA